MGFSVIGDLIANTGDEDKEASVGQFGFQATLKAQENMPFFTPVVSRIAGGIFHHPHTNITEVLGAPQRLAGDAGMFGGFDVVPIRNAKWNISDFH